MSVLVELERLSLDEIARTMARLSPRLEKLYVERAINRAGTLLVRDIRKATKGRPWSKSERGLRNRKTGAPLVGLSKSAMKRPSKKWPSSPILARRGIIGVAVGHQYPHGQHAHLVEYGHRLVKKTGGGMRVIKQIPPHPYMRPVWENRKGEILAMIKSAILDGLRKDIARLQAGKKVSRTVTRFLEGLRT